MHNAYCKLDHLGDIKPVVETSRTDQGLLALADLRELDFYMYLTDTVLVRVFDLMRYEGIPLSIDGSEELMHIEYENTELHARLIISDNTQSYLRGFQIIHRISSDERMQLILEGKDLKPKQYVSFIALDWKQKEVHECSCAPADLASYFEESDLPFQVTPAFFRPEVMLKYKQNPDKYSFVQRQISCRGTWSLRYDINEQGQAHAYLCDLQNLPF